MEIKRAVLLDRQKGLTNESCIVWKSEAVFRCMALLEWLEKGKATKSRRKRKKCSTNVRHL